MLILHAVVFDQGGHPCLAFRSMFRPAVFAKAEDAELFLAEHARLAPERKYRIIDFALGDEELPSPPRRK